MTPAEASRDRGEPGPPLPRVRDVRHAFVDVDGIRIHVAEAGSGPTLLLLHGEPQHWYLWRHVFDRLSSHYHIVAPDLRGMGWSDAPRSSYRKEELAADIRGVIDALDLRDIRLVGHDYGGIVGFLLCLQRPERIARYLALATYHPWIGGLGVAANLPREWYQLITMTPALGPAVVRRAPGFWPFLMRRGVRTPGTWAPGEVEHYASHVATAPRAEAISRYARSLLADALDFRRLYATRRLTVPTRMLLGARDFAISPRLVRGWEAHADDMSVEVLRDTSHWIPNEVPDRVVHAITTFLR